MEMQTPEDSSGLVFAVTDVLRGVRYFVAERAPHYEVEVPTKAGYAKVAVSKEADVIDVADQLIRLLDNADELRRTNILHSSGQAQQLRRLQIPPTNLSHELVLCES